MRNILLIFALLSVLVTGCGKTIVKGKVHFEDGSPLSKGTIYFESEKFSFRGDIQSDGTYTAVSPTGGAIPKGQYRVAITDAVDRIGPTDYVSQPGGPPPVFQETQLIGQKFVSVTTSGLSVEVKGATTYDVAVEK